MSPGIPSAALHEVARATTDAELLATDAEHRPLASVNHRRYHVGMYLAYLANAT